MEQPSQEQFTVTVAQAIALALQHVGVTVATHVPGHGATQTFAAFCKLTGESPISVHEEPAFAIAHGAALAGRRSACIIKSHGLTKAMNGVMDSLSCGVTNGMVTLVFEDKGGSHSDNIIEILPVIDGAEMPRMISSASTVYEDVCEAYTKSIMLQLPYTVVIDSAIIDHDTTIGRPPKRKHSPVYHRDPVRHLVCPILAPYQRQVLLQKLHPDPHFKEFIPRPQLPILPDGLPPAYQAAVSPYLPLFTVFKKLSVDFVCGDAGVSTLSALPPFNIAHAALYMGGSIPTAIGTYLAGCLKSWAFIGDFSFISAGHYGLIEALLRKAPIKVLIYANGKAQTTGGQPLDLGLLETVLAGYDPYILHLDDPFDAEETERVLRETNEANELRIVIANYSGR